MRRAKAVAGDLPVITARTEFVGTHRQGRLASMLSEHTITDCLGVLPVRDPDGGEKVTLDWAFYADGTPCAIWDYKGARWSFFGPRAIFDRLFPGNVAE